MIRYLDLAAYHYLNPPKGVREFYFILITEADKPPWILTRYRSMSNLRKGLTDPGLFAKTQKEVITELSRAIGWLSLERLKQILQATRQDLKTRSEQRFVDDLILYLGYKMKEAERIRNERNQMSFWP